jgi:hypothetical protein
MKKRLIATLFVLSLAFAASISARAAGGSLDNFKVHYTYTSNRYTDIEGASWYAMDVQACYEYGLMSGVATNAFAPGSSLTVGEALKIADSLNSIYNTGKADFKAGSPWYKAYSDYALKKGLISSVPVDYSAAVTRAQFADMISKALPSQALAAACQVADNAIPDVSTSDSFGADVYRLYRAGVLTGCDSFGTFRPFAPLSRAEAAAITARASNADFRKSLSLPQALSGADIFRKCSPAVFYLER